MNKYKRKEINTRQNETKVKSIGRRIKKINKTYFDNIEGVIL